jgi:Fe-S cluster assembly protein SufD
VQKNKTIEKPILIHYTSSAHPVSSSIQSRNLVIVEQGAKANIVESFSSESEIEMFRNHVSEVVVGANAFVNYYKLQNQNKATYLIDNTYISQYRDSKVQAFTVSLEGKIIRNNLNFLLEDENSEAHMFGLYVAHEDTHIDNHTSVDHKFPNCFSNEIYKGILDDHSKGVFNGKIFVQQDAQKTNAFQSNKNILLSDTATINTKPQLEIWADDVSCSHGCTTGQLDEEQLFYLRSRGISESKAKAMLLHAFVNDVIDEIEVSFLHDFINDEMYNRLD